MSSPRVPSSLFQSMTSDRGPSFAFLGWVSQGRQSLRTDGLDQVERAGLRRSQRTEQGLLRGTPEASLEESAVRLGKLISLPARIFQIYHGNAFQDGGLRKTHAKGNVKMPKFSAQPCQACPLVMVAKQHRANGWRVLGGANGTEVLHH